MTRRSGMRLKMQMDLDVIVRSLKNGNKLQNGSAQGS
jgi:hypothetical protein